MSLRGGCGALMTTEPVAAAGSAAQQATDAIPVSVNSKEAELSLDGTTELLVHPKEVEWSI